jgi:hypothetical protein
MEIAGIYSRTSTSISSSISINVQENTITTILQILREGGKEEKLTRNGYYTHSRN